MGFFKSDPPPPPNYGPLIAAQTQASQQQYQLGQEQLQFERDQWSAAQTRLDPIIQQQTDIAKQQMDYAAQLRNDWTTNALPVQNQFIGSIGDYQRAVTTDMNAATGLDTSPIHSAAAGYQGLADTTYQNALALQGPANALNADAQRFEDYAYSLGAPADQVFNTATGFMADTQAYADKANAFYDTAKNFASPANRQLYVGEAEAAVAQQMDSARQAALQNLESYGVDPSTARMGALDIGLRTAQAAAAAGAGTAASQWVTETGLNLTHLALGDIGQAMAAEAQGVNAMAQGFAAKKGAVDAAYEGFSARATGFQGLLGAYNAQIQAMGVEQNAFNNQVSAFNADVSRSQAINAATAQQGNLTGMGPAYINALSSEYLGNANTAINQAITAGGSSINAINQGLSTYGSLTGTPGSYMSLGNQSLSGAVNTTSTGYSNSLDAYKAEQNASSGIGSALGTAAKVGVAALPLLLNRGGSVEPTNFSANGGLQVPAPVPVPQPTRVPPTMSPSGGRAIDDVPARLTAGEFVLPRDVVSWVGEQQLQKLIQKTRADRGQALQSSGAARPSVRPAVPTRPTFVSAGAQRGM